MHILQYISMNFQVIFVINENINVTYVVLEVEPNFFFFFECGLAMAGPWWSLCIAASSGPAVACQQWATVALPSSSVV